MQKLLYKNKRDHTILTFTILATVAVYSRFFFFGHISWDDPEMVFRNADVKNSDIRAFFTGHYVGNYLPVTMTVHWISWLLFGSNNWGHHLVNILLHLLNGMLVYQASRKLFQNSAALTAAVIFLLHPLQVESVGWISELKNVLSSTFYLAGILFYINYRQQKNKSIYLTFLFFILGCLSKSSVVVLPLSLLCIDYFMQGSVRKKDLLEKIPFFILSIVFGIINIKTQTADLFINHSHEFPYFQRIGYAGFAILKYLLLFIFPFKLSVIYPYPPAAAIVTGYLFIVFLASVFFYLIRKKHPQQSAILLFIICNLVLVLQFLPFGEVLYADRYQYIPLIGFAWILGLYLARIKKYHVVIILIAVFLGSLTFARAGKWSSAITLYEDILEKYPTQFIALNSAGVERMFMNDDAKALAYFNEAIQAAPRNYKSYYNRGLLFIKNKKPQDAIRSFNNALALYDYPKAYTGRAAAYYMLGDIPKAMSDAQKAIASDRMNSRAHFVLGNCYNDLNKVEEAITAYNTSIKISGEEPDYYFKRAIARGKLQDYSGCVSDLDRCIKLNPLYYEAYYWRGVAKVNLKTDPCYDFKIAAGDNFEPAIKAFRKYCN